MMLKFIKWLSKMLLNRSVKFQKQADKYVKMHRIVEDAIKSREQSDSGKL